MKRSRGPVLLLVVTASCGGAGEVPAFLDASPPDPVSTPPPEHGPIEAATAYDGGPPVHGAVGGDGGAVSRLYFAVVGDTRPAAKDDTAGYPSAVIAQIYARMAALSPAPTFAVATGDYQFSSPRGDAAYPQVDLYAKARAAYRGLLLPAMGNHECTGATASNCGEGNTDGLTSAYRAFQDRLLAPIGKTAPYYEVDVNAGDGSWTSKVLVVAANAWTISQAAWLRAAMSRPTTYTFVVRHEPSYATAAPGVAPSEGIMTEYPYTLAICGHKHSYEHPRPREIVVGNGGAPLTGSKSYGFAMISQQSDRSLAVDMIDYASGLADPSFHFTIDP